MDPAPKLDSNCPSTISQLLATTEGGAYTLCAYYSSRPGVADNTIRVRWNGAKVLMLEKDGATNSDTVWKRYCISPLMATGSPSLLEFQHASVADTFGGLLDQVSVVSVAP